MHRGTASSKLVFGMLIAVALLVMAAILVIPSRPAPTPGLTIEVAKAWSDSVDSPSGMVYYLLGINVTNGGPGTWHFDPSFLVLTSNDSAAYSAAGNYSAMPVLVANDIGSGQHASGEVAFELPIDQRPAGLQYKDSADGIATPTIEVPSVTGTATKFDPSVHFTFNGTSASRSIATWAAITNQSDALTFFGGEKGYRNYSFVFFTGQEIYVTFTFYYYRYPYDPNTIAVTAVTSDDGYAISDLQAWPSLIGFPGTNVGHPLPAYLTGYGAETSVTLLVTVPSGHPDGVLHFTVQWSS